MKRFFTLAALLTLGLGSAQQTEAQMLDFEGMPPYKLGITVGANVPTISSSGFGVTGGFQTGADLMVDASDIWANSFGRVQLKYSMKGATADGDGVNGYLTTHYLEMPVHYGYSWKLTDDVTVMAEAGPYVAVGLGGKYREEYSVADPITNRVYTDSKSRTFFGDMDANRFDFGVGLQASILYAQRYQLHVAYDWGFINMNDPYFLQNRNFSVGFTYYIDF